FLAVFHVAICRNLLSSSRLRWPPLRETATIAGERQKARKMWGKGSLAGGTRENSGKSGEIRRKMRVSCGHLSALALYSPLCTLLRPDVPVWRDGYHARERMLP